MVYFSNSPHRSRGRMFGNILSHGWHIVTVRMQQFWNDRVRDPVVEQIQRGVPTKRVARAATLGIVSAAWPQIGTNPIMAWILARVFRCGSVVAMGVSLIGSPLQYVFMIPLLRLGEWLLGVEPFRITLAEILVIVFTDPIGSFKVLGLPLLHAVVGWSVLGLLSYYPLFCLVHHLVRITAERLKRSGNFHAKHH